MGDGSAKARPLALATGAAAVGLAVSLWLPWYGSNPDKFGKVTAALIRRFHTNTTLNAWSSFNVLDVILFATAILGLATMFMVLSAPAARWSQILGVATSVVAVAGAVMTFINVVNPIGDGAVLKAGAILGLVCAIVVAAATTMLAGRPESDVRPA